jgi:BirA family biotin operon repressor/biotin-[acetyl-CoA-carboxylase] ligase
MLRFNYISIDSTSLQARRLWNHCHDSRPLLVVAETQTAGIGRLGRSWKSPHGGLWLSIAWPLLGEVAHYDGLPLAVGCSVAESVELIAARRGGRLRCLLKWPNDVLVRERKLAGVLCQCDPDGPRPVVVVGIGINANFPAATLGNGLRYPATTLQDELGVPVDLAALLEDLLIRLQATLSCYPSEGLTERLPAIRGRLAWVGRAVEVRVPGRSEACAGRLCDVDSRGHLLMDDGGGTRALAAGELRCLENAQPPAPVDRPVDSG